MEADWEFEIGPDAPVIDGAWSGFLDLRRHPEQLAAVSELANCPALELALLRLNTPESPVFTTKCDVWNPGEVDPDELDAPRESARHALACYIDLLPIEASAWPTPESAAAWSRALCASLRDVPLRQCRADLIVRRAFRTLTEQGIGLTCYVTACGATESEAADVLSRAMHALSGAATRVGSCEQ